ncbi:MAG: putative E3 ubiquitin-protein ligase herc4 [Marteilia pararefringens]
MHAPLPLVLFKKLLDRPLSCLEDLEELKPETYHGLKKILEYEDDDLEQIFGLNFSLDIEGDKDNNIGGSEKHDTSDDNSCQAQNIIELIPNGQNINVTKLNRDVYIEKIVDYYLNIAVEKNFLSFKSGFFKVLSKPLMSIFEPEQLQELLIGREIMDFDILRENCDYFEGYYAKHPIIERFWDVFYSLHYLDKLKFIKFLTGCERLPFDRKKFRMRIRCTRGGEQYLPVAHTCANMLDLPEYQSANLMKKKLLRSMYDSSGFTLV